MNEDARKREKRQREGEEGREGERMKIKGWLNWAQISKVNFVRKLQWTDKSVPVNEFCLPGLQLNLCSFPYPFTSSSEVA